MPGLFRRLLPLALLPLAPAAFAATGGEHATNADFTHSLYGYLAVGIFVLAYLVVILEDVLHLRKSKPVLDRKSVV